MDLFQSWLMDSFEDLQFILFFGLLLVLIVAEQLFHFREIRRRKSRWVANFAMTFIAIITLMAIPVSFISLAEWASANHWGLFNIVQPHWAILLLLTFLIRGFVSFFTHYLAHKVPFLWRIHRVHHLDTELDVTTNVRFHPFEFIVNIIIGAPIILLSGLPVWGLMLYELLDVVVTLVSHANISFPEPLEKVLRRIIVTPDLHRIHHSAHQPETDSNFSAVFPVWDMIFRTYKTKTIVPPHRMQIGLKEVQDERTNSIVWLMLSPFRKSISN